ncbi:hypothetical protein [Sutterella sp.]|uniref:hypothetical protein n=1 Tax=Sutterella sp. TaxID=1981025 RepID=UPI0026DF5A2E|nr:hypothetical protein [Sutterella sp.]MDO5532922.1 hypothetical protein [Sutterella sp.]
MTASEVTSSSTAADAASSFIESVTALPAGLAAAALQDPAAARKFAENVLQFRNGALESLPWFLEQADRALFPIAGTIASMRKFFETEFGAGEVALKSFDRNSPQMIRKMALGTWAVEKLCVGLEPEVAGPVLADMEWWKAFTTDWVLDHFTPWALWIALPPETTAEGEGKGRALRGFFTGLTATESGPALWCQPAYGHGDLPPEEWFEIPLRSGRTLGDVAGSLAFTHFAAGVLEEQAGEKGDSAAVAGASWRDRMGAKVRAHAAKFLPLLVAAVGDEYARECLRVDLGAHASEPASTALPVRDTRGGDVALIRAMTARTLTVVKVTQQKAKDLN